MFRSKEDAPAVEQFIWGKVCRDFDNFAGIDELSYEDLIVLRDLVKRRLVYYKRRE